MKTSSPKVAANRYNIEGKAKVCSNPIDHKKMLYKTIFYLSSSKGMEMAVQEKDFEDLADMTIKDLLMMFIKMAFRLWGKDINAQQRAKLMNETDVLLANLNKITDPNFAITLVGRLETKADMLAQKFDAICVKIDAKSLPSDELKVMLKSAIVEGMSEENLGSFANVVTRCLEDVQFSSITTMVPKENGV